MTTTSRRIVRRISGLGLRVRNSLGKSKKRSQKLIRRLRDPQRRRATAWCKKHSSDLEAITTRIDAATWSEARDVKRAVARLRRSRLESLGLHGAQPSDIGGGPGNLALLYWLVRVFRPQTVVETGVASGASSRAILQGLFANGSGHLYSSDLSGVIPREFSGLCVDEAMYSRWTLLHEGDRVNIPLILSGLESIDLLHYDSAKDAGEMQWVIEQTTPLLGATAVVVLDDIDRHPFMSDYVQGLEKSWHVFGSVGVIGLDEASERLQSP